MNALKIFLLFSVIFSVNIFAKPDTPSSQTASTYGVKVVDTKTAQELAQSGAIFVDTRKVTEYAIEHIKGSISAYYDEKGGNDNKHVDFDSSKDIYYDSRISTNKEESLIFYCNGIKCWKSYKAAVTTAKKGYTNVYWLQDGIGQWKQDGFELDGVNILAKLDTLEVKDDFTFHVGLGVVISVVLAIILFFIFRYIIMKKAYLISTKLLSNIFIVVISMSIIGYFSLNSAQDGKDAMSNIYEDNFKPQNELLHAINNFNSIQNNLSYSLTGLMAFEGARVALIETRKNLKHIIDNVMKSQFYSDEKIKKSFDIIISEYQNSNKLLDILELAYLKEDKKTLVKLASNEWALSSAIINKQFNTIEQKVNMKM